MNNLNNLNNLNNRRPPAFPDMKLTDPPAHLRSHTTVRCWLIKLRG